MGGNLLLNGSSGIIFPYPLSRENFRTMAFVDAGNVYAAGTPIALAGTLAGAIRFAGGISLEWRSPFGPLAFSLAKAINKEPTDREQMFQFSLSSSF
jgi:outer membrane protein insertion porin family